MSLFDYSRHERQGHGDEGVHRLADGAALCVQCFLDALADPSELAARRHYSVRQFAELVAPSSATGGRGQQQQGLLQELLAAHAAPLVARMLAALAVAGGTDADLAGALLDALLVVADGAPHFVPEMAADRWGGMEWWWRCDRVGLGVCCSWRAAVAPCMN